MRSFPPFFAAFLIATCGAVRPGFPGAQGSIRLPVSGRASSGIETHILKPAADVRETDNAPVRPPQRWGLLIAGSAGWWNYRHQADVCHAYHLLKEGGVHTSNIITLMYNDIAHSTDNPYPGKIFNRPGGSDVYEGVAVDYQGDEVNVTTLLAVLEGDKEAVKSLGTGKVVDSGPNDEVFLFFSDHGAPGVLGMPVGPMLYADQLLDAIRRKRTAGGYKEMTMYIEACESGSLFQNMENDLELYITTAANANESSWGTYCPGIDSPLAFQGNGSTELDTCMGDLFSVAWMEDSEQYDPAVETLRVQYDHVSLRTSNNFTYNMGSHVQRFGQVSAMESEHVGDYIGHPTKKPPSRTPTETTSVATPAAVGPQNHATVAQRDADLVPLRVHAARAPSAQVRAEAQAELDAVLQRRAAVDAKAEQLVLQLLLHPETSHLLIHNNGWHPETVYTSIPGTPQRVPQPSILMQLVSGSIKSFSGPFVDSWECLRELERAWVHAVGPMDQYSMKHTRLLANLCNSGLNEHALLAAVSEEHQQ